MIIMIQNEEPQETQESRADFITKLNKDIEAFFAKGGEVDKVDPTVRSSVSDMTINERTKAYKEATRPRQKNPIM